MIRSGVFVAAGSALLAAGCGSGGSSPSVASLPPSQHGVTTARNAQSEPSVGGLRLAGGVALQVQDGPKFSACMRSHGVPNFPDPNAQGVVQFGSGSGVDPGSPKFQAAMSACRKVLPDGGRASPQQVAKAQQAALKFSACMRGHGLKDFPDPSFAGGAVRLSINSRPGSDLDPSSPLFQKAQKACLAFSAGKTFTPGGVGPK